jgi:hypothetical protein
LTAPITITIKPKKQAEIIQDTSRIIHSLGWMAEIQLIRDYNGGEVPAQSFTLSRTRQNSYGEPISI